jgi:hypothetical protein
MISELKYITGYLPVCFTDEIHTSINLLKFNLSAGWVPLGMILKDEMGRI